jgi:hypothetical protein
MGPELTDDNSLTQQTGQKVITGEFEQYLVNSLNESLFKKSNFPVV